MQRRRERASVPGPAAFFNSIGKETRYEAPEPHLEKTHRRRVDAGVSGRDAPRLPAQRAEAAEHDIEQRGRRHGPHMGRIRGGHAGVLPADGAARGLRSEPAGLFLRPARLPQLGGGRKAAGRSARPRGGCKSHPHRGRVPRKGGRQSDGRPPSGLLCPLRRG